MNGRMEAKQRGGGRGGGGGGGGGIGGEVKTTVNKKYKGHNRLLAKYTCVYTRKSYSIGACFACNYLLKT